MTAVMQRQKPCESVWFAVVVRMVAPLRTPTLGAMNSALAVAIAYLIGSIDFGVIVPRLMGIDIYEQGSGNPGTSNVFRTMGKGPAVVVMVGDLVKGIVAAAIGSTMGGETVGFAAGLAAVVGHVFPVWHGFKGGRGVATAIGAAVWLAPLWGLVIAIGWGVSVAITRTASVASLVAMVLYVPAFAIAGNRGWQLVFAAATALVVIGRHADNIRRLLSGSENTVEQT